MSEKPPVRTVSEADQTVTGHRKWMVPLVSKNQRIILSIFLVLWIVSVVRFALWWFDPSRRLGLVGLVLTSLAIGFTMLLPIWLFFASLRARRPRSDLSFGGGRVAMIVTKAPAEPWTLVRHTIVAMLHQDYEGPYDVWLADEQPSEETVAWCEKRGVKISSRHNIASYHQPGWPRRTRSKEGNLAYFYDQWGYDNYEVVCQFDADHVPRPDYLRIILRGFADPRVGYVAAPSICSAQSQYSWTARSRLHKEAALHGILQAGHNDGYAPTCIGSHYAVRTQAVREIGGIGPELAEDFSTSFLLAAHGWRGVFDIEAIAEGEGPHTFIDGMTQELQWARSLTTVALRYTGGHWKNLRKTERFRFAFTLCWYPVFVGHMLLAIFLSPAAILLKRPWVSVTLIEFFLHAAVPTMIVLGTMIFLRRQRWLRPQEAPVISWEGALYHLTRWPWNLLGIIQAITGVIRGKEIAFRVTPKTRDGDVRPLPAVALLPTAAMTAIQASVILFTTGQRPFGYILLATLAALVYAIATAAVLVLHLVEDDAPLLRGVRASLPAVVVAASTASLAAVAGLQTLQDAQTLWGPRLATDLLGTQYLSGQPLVIYAVTLIGLAGYAVWDRRTTDEQWWLREILDQLPQPATPMRPRRTPPLPRQLRRPTRAELQFAADNGSSSMATSSSAP